MMKSILHNPASELLAKGVMGKLKMSFISLFIFVSLGQFLQAQSDYDLALRIFPTSSEPVQPEDIASFTFEVHNQGDIAAQNIKIVDYIPDGLEFISSGNSGWASVGSKAITTVTAIIEPGDFYTLSLNLRLKSTATSHNISNYAEIALSQDDQGNDTTFDDIDSSTDSDPLNDQGANAFTDSDDNLLGTGLFDEDDHDVALLIICGQNACNDHVNISLNAACSIEILADMIVENPDYPDGAYTVVLEDENGNIMPDNMVDGSHIGMTFKVTAFIEGCEGSGCWGYATIEDKFAIDLYCEVDTVDCGGQSPDDVGLPLEPGVFYFKISDNSYRVPGVNGCSDIILSYEDAIEMQPCQTGSPYVIKITRDWLAVDGVGNTEECTSEVYVRKGYLSDIVPPADIVDFPLECGQFPSLPDGNPDPSFTGRPTGTDCPNIIIVFEDLVIPNSTCPSAFDVLREWTIVDWCNSTDTSFQQLIKIMDTTAPNCSAPSKFIGSASYDKCQGTIDVVNPFLSDNCGGVTFTIGYKSTIGTNKNDYTDYIDDNVFGSEYDYSIGNLPVGNYYIAYFAEDECGNTSRCNGRFEIRDNQEPTPICIIDTTLYLDQFGNASINASDLDKGSFDNCGVDYFRARRMNFGCGQSTSFESTVNFCCSDVGEETMVVFRVYDDQGNFNECMVMVTIIDDEIPTIQCPGDFTFTCSQYDQYNQNIPVFLTGQATADDNCNLDIDHFDTKAFNECGVGIIVRNWTAIDPAGNLVSCKQYIEIESDFQFDEDMIQWPEDAIVNQCLGDPINTDATGLPNLPSASCSSFTIDFDDKTVQNNGAGCGFVERTFTVTDNCALDPNNNSYSYVQLIEVFENEDPVFVECEDITVSANNSTCSGFISYTAQATDNCTSANKLKFNYTIDVFNDGSIDENNNGKNLFGNYPNGTHRAVFFSEDECGNIGTCAFLFTVQDEKFPTPICLPISVTLDEDGEVEVWASDFNHKSFDNCTDEDDLLFAFSENIYDLNRTFDCNDIENGVSGTVSIQMYVFDAAGNFDFCTVTLTITDSEDFCPDAGSITAKVSGKVMSIQNEEEFSSVQVTVEGEDMNGNKEEMTDISGDYTFSALSLYDNYTVRPYKNDDALNGISTLDIVAIQKHILGIAPLSGMQQTIAADVNRSESITGTDIVQLRKLLLGKYVDDYFPENDSWRFIPAGFEWDEYLPFEFPEEILVENLLADVNDAMFYGIKVGDINASSTINLHEEKLETRTLPAKLIIENQSLIANELVSIPVYLEDGANVEGFQLAIRFDSQKFDVQKVSSPSFTLTDENYSIKDEYIFISWNQIGGVNLEAGEILFTIEVKSTDNVKVYSEDLGLLDNFSTEIFNTEGAVKTIDLEVRQEEGYVKATQLVQNSPNPFSSETAVNYHLGTSTSVQFTLYGVNGSIIHQFSEVGVKGENYKVLDGQLFPTDGIYYLSLETDEWMTTIKMIKLN